MTERKDINLDRERIACVFGLGGGELHEPHPDFPDEWDDVIAYWYEGVPEYVALADLDLDHDDEVRTAILDVLFRYPEPPEGWERVASFSNSGERECWWCSEGAGDGTGNEDQRDECDLCEGDGVVYLGEGWCEVVYRRREQTE
jgi:hypothetical protein